MKLITGSLLSLLFTSLSMAAALDPGLTHSLAVKRADQIRDLSYSLDFKIPESPKEKISGLAEINFSLKATADPVVLDFKGEASDIKEAKLNGESVEVKYDHQHLVFDRGLRAGSNSLVIRYETLPASLNRNPDYVYTLFVPDRASQAFPCFDQPDLKAKFTLTLQVSKDWKVVSNEKEGKPFIIGNEVKHAFVTTKPISTYLVAFAAGKFKVATESRDGRVMNMYYRESDVAKVNRNQKTIFDLHALSLKKMENYTAVSYPFSKFDFVLLPSFPFGGMEHPGAIF
jgi:aminopeptidase N